MHGRKKQLLSSFKADDFGSVQQASTAVQQRTGSVNSSVSGHVTSVSETQMTSLNLNQPLTDQLTQQKVRMQAAGNPGRGAVSGPGQFNRTLSSGQSHPGSEVDIGLDHRGQSSRSKSPAPIHLLPSFGSPSSSLAPLSSLSSSSCSLPISASSSRTGISSSRKTNVVAGDTFSSGAIASHKPPLSSARNQQQSQHSRSHSPSGLIVPPLRDSSGYPLVGPGPPGFQVGELDAATLTRLAAIQQAQVAALRFPLATPALLSPFLLQSDSALTRHLEQLWQAKFPQRPVPPPWMLQQFQEDLFRDTRLPSATSDSRDHRNNDQRLEPHERTPSRIFDVENEQQLAKDRHLDRDLQTSGKRTMTTADRRCAWDAPGSTVAGPKASRAEAERRTERSLIVQQTASCAADAVQQHFNESLLRLHATSVAPQKGFFSGPGGTTTASVQLAGVLPTPWNPALSSSSPVGSSSSAFAPPPTSFKKSPISVDQLKEHSMSVSQQAQAVPLLCALTSYGRMLDERVKSEERMLDSKGRVDDRSKSDSRLKSDSRIKAEEIYKYEDSVKYEEYPSSRDSKFKLEDRNRYDEKVKSEERHQTEERVWNDERLRCERVKFDDQVFNNEKEDLLLIRPRPAHTGSANESLYLSGSTKMRSNAMNNSSGRLEAPVTGQPELNFNLYGYQPYQTKYISNDKLNHVMPISNGGDSRADKNSTLGSVARMSGSSAELAGDVGNAKQTSVIVERRRNIQPVIEGYRNRGSITQGTPGDPSLFRSGPPGTNWFDSIPRTEQIHVDDHSWAARHTKRQVNCNGLSWQKPGNGSTSVSPPRKSDLIQQGLVPNPLYSSAALTSGPSRSGDDQSKKNQTSPVPRDMHSTLSKNPGPASSNTITGLQGFQASYIDSFKSFVDRAVQSAFMEDNAFDHLGPNVTTVASVVSTANLQTEPLRTVVSSVYRTLPRSPSIGLVNSDQTGATLPVVGGRPYVDVQIGPTSAHGVINSGSSVGLPYSIAALNKSCTSSSFAIPGTGSVMLIANHSSELLLQSSATTSGPGIQTMPSLTSLVTRSAPALVSSISTSPPAPQFNADPPLLVPQRPICFQVQDGATKSGFVISTMTLDEQSKVTTATASSSMCCDLDSDTLSAHSPAPLLVPMTSTPPPSSTGTASGPNNWHPKFKKSWLLRYSDEDRKSTPNGVVQQLPAAATPLKQECSDDKVDDHKELAEKLNEVKYPKVKQSEVVKVESLAECNVEKSQGAIQPSKTDIEDPNSHTSDNSMDSDDRGMIDKDAVRNCYIKCSDIMSKDHDNMSPRKGLRESYEDKDDGSAMTAESSDSQPTAGQSRKRKSCRKSTPKTKCKSSDSTPLKKQKTSSRDTADANSTYSTSDHSTTNSDEQPPKATNSKPSSVGGGKVSKTSTAPSSDCETKIAFRVKELKGKVRTGTLSSVLENKPLNRVTSEARRKKTREPYVQDGPCYDVTPKLMKCRECKLSNGQRNNSQLANNIFCRFYAFRKLCYSAKGSVAVSGFCKPSDADADDIELWLPVTVNDRRFTVDKAKYTIAILCDSFVRLLEDEKEAADLGKAHASKVVWKRAIQGVREMCDACDATLFNVHWTCAKCGFAVCVECYRSRRSSTTLQSSSSLPSDWLTCSANKQPHDVDNLMMTHIIPSDILTVVNRMLSDVVMKWHIRCTSKASTENGAKTNSNHINGVRTTHGTKCAKARKRKVPKEESDDSLTRMKENGGASKCNGFDTDVNEDLSNDSCKETIHGSSAKLLDGGRLLRVTVSVLDGEDLTAFQHHWQKALPVLVSRPDAWYRSDIWRPSALARCGGYPALDATTGADIPASRYWEQFERLGRCQTVCTSSVFTKDWPSPEELTAFTTHLRDLDAGLPLPEYTRLGGVLHSMSHLPEYFVRPELSTLRIHGHGLSANGQVALHSKLRVDSTDTVATTVFVGSELQDYDLQKNTSLSAALGEVTRLVQSCTKNASKPVCAVWHVFRPQDADVIRDLLAKIAGTDHQDALAETNSYLDASLRTRLANEHSVYCSTVVQCLGDTIFVPAMAPHQVCAVQNCIIASREFLSPESLRYCHNSGNSRRIRNTKTSPSNNFEDQLQGKNLIYHTVKDAIAVLKSADP